MKKIGIVVASLESKTITRNNGVSAYASWDKTTADGYEFIGHRLRDQIYSTNIVFN
jgi:hypothetical protein